MAGSRRPKIRRESWGTVINVVHNQAGYLARPTTKAPEKQIYFINSPVWSLSVLRVRTVVRGEQASQSIVNRTTALWSIWGVASLILAGLGLRPSLSKRGSRNRRLIAWL